MLTRILLLSLLLAAPLFADAGADYQALLEAFKAKRYAETLEKAEKFTADHADYKYADAAHYMGGNAGLNGGDYARGEELYRALLEKHPGSRHAGKARNELVTLLDAARRLEDCIAQCEANLKAEPEGANRDRWTYMIGQSRFRLWQFEQAEKDLKAFQKQFPDSKLQNSAIYYLERINPKLEIDKNGLVTGYNGKFVDDARFQAALKRMPREVADAWKILKRTLGVDLKGAQVVFEFRDKGFVRDTNRAITETIAVDYKPYTRIIFYTEHVVVSTEDHRSRIVHELKHAAFRDVMGQAYLDLPKWVREGLAVYGAEQLEDRLAAIVGGETFSGRDPRKLLDGIDDADHDTNDYLEDAAAFLWLEGRKKGAVHAFCQRLLKGEDYGKLYAELSGLPLREALDTAAAFTLELVEKRMGDAEEQFIRIRDEDFRNGGKAEWVNEKGAEQYRAWLKANPDHPLAANCRYRLGKALINAGKYEEGRTSLRQVLELDQVRSSICDDAQYWIALSYEREGEAERAKQAWGVLLRDYSWSRAAIERKDTHHAAGPEKDK
ncbi:MAG: tetratricopeptide repeat protein [Planctomycetota bacterium]|nr:tetratricopeptide repeat protein [Planctomycetota bacterium]